MLNLKGLFWLAVICCFWVIVAVGFVLVFVAQGIVDVLLWMIMPCFDGRFFEDF